MSRYKKGDILETEITDLTSTALGVGTVDGFAFFVKGALPKERVRFKVIDIYSSRGFGVIDEILQESADRTKPMCPVFSCCGGCALQHLKYDAQLLYKTNKVISAMRVIGKCHIEKISCKGMEDPYRYRNRTKHPAGLAEGEAHAGFYAERSHTFVSVKDCLLCPQEFGVIAQLVFEFINENKLPVYNEKTKEGIIRHLIMRKSSLTGKILICLVINMAQLPCAGELMRIMAPMHMVSGICINTNMKETNVIMGDNTICLYGEPYITDKLCGIEYNISVDSFFQVNRTQTEAMYKRAIEYSRGGGMSCAIDIFCGIGTVTLLLAKEYKQVYGIEIAQSSVEDARVNAARNGFNNIKFMEADAATAVTLLAIKGVKPDCIVVNPPRKGCDDKLIELMLEMRPMRIVYISCNPATLARDTALLSNGYELKEISLFDCFPQTAHIESIVLFIRA